MPFVHEHTRHSGGKAVRVAGHMVTVPAGHSVVKNKMAHDILGPDGKVKGTVHHAKVNGKERFPAHRAGKPMQGFQTAQDATDHVVGVGNPVSTKRVLLAAPGATKSPLQTLAEGLVGVAKHQAGAKARAEVSQAAKDKKAKEEAEAKKKAEEEAKPKPIVPDHAPMAAAAHAHLAKQHMAMSDFHKNIGDDKKAEEHRNKAIGHVKSVGSMIEKTKIPTKKDAELMAGLSQSDRNLLMAGLTRSDRDLIVALAMSPGGRPADDSPFSSSKTSNWVARAGGLPKYIREVAHALVRSGHPESEAIGMAVGIVRNWAEGKGKGVSAKVKAAAAAAIAEWEQKKAKAHAKSGAKDAKNAAS